MPHAKTEETKPDSLICNQIGAYQRHNILGIQNLKKFVCVPVGPGLLICLGLGRPGLFRS